MKGGKKIYMYIQIILNGLCDVIPLYSIKSSVINRSSAALFGSRRLYLAAPYQLMTASPRNAERMLNTRATIPLPVKPSGSGAGW